MSDLISRADAIDAVQDVDTRETVSVSEAVKALMALPSAEPTFTEEVREALMRLTMCAREECGMCKYKDDCDFDKQYEMATENMNTILNAFKCVSAERVVRCKDCLQKHIGGSVTHYYWCDRWDMEVDDTDYCAWGERREE